MNTPRVGEFTRRRNIQIHPNKLNLQFHRANLKDSSDSKEKQSVYQDFLQTTSFPGLAQYGRQTKRLGKFGWIMCFILGIALSMFQSWGLITSYYAYMTYEQSVLKMNGTLPFPAITICNRNPVKWKEAIKTKIGDMVQFDPTIKRDIMIRYDKDFRLMKALKNYSLSPDPDYEKIFFTKSELSPYCVWNWALPCNEKDFVTFIHPYYGTCFTFNSGISPDRTKLTVYPGSDLVMSLFVDRTQDPDFLARSPGLVALLHESGTPPILSSPTALYIYPGDWVKVTLRVQKISRLKAPYPSHCVDSTDLNYRKKMVYYSEKYPYLYSTQGCLTTCHQNRTLENCKCLLNKIPSYPKPDTLCFELKNRCSLDTAKMKLETCDCPLPCEELIYGDRVIFDNTALTHPFFQDAIRFRYEKLIKSVFSNSSEFGFAEMKQTVAAIQVLFESSFFEDSAENSKYSVADFWGAIGGNIGFWTGISVLVFMEILAFVFTYAASKFTDLRTAAGNKEQRQQIMNRHNHSDLPYGYRHPR